MDSGASIRQNLGSQKMSAALGFVIGTGYGVPLLFRRAAVLKRCERTLSARKDRGAAHLKAQRSLSDAPAVTVAEKTGSSRNVLDTLRERGLVEQMSGDAEGTQLRALLEKPTAVYVGFDPTADSLHLGNLLAIVVLRWFQLHGHKTIALVGGATGKVGDPSGKSTERPQLDDSTIEKNMAGVSKNISTVLSRNPPQEFADCDLKEPEFVNNGTWMGPMGFLDFLRDIGKHARVNTMLNKESVKNRLGADGDGMSFTEFTYQLLQAYDFVHLRRTQGVRIQLGGSDQWGNITAGIELARKLGVTNDRADVEKEDDTALYGLTFPLLTKADGKKFGKSESGAIWLAPEKLSPYGFYQNVMRTADADVINLLKRVTFEPLERIEQLEQEMESSPNAAQRALAEALTLLVHGKEGLEKALAATAVAAPGAAGGGTLDAELLDMVAEEMRCVELPRDDLVGCGVIDLMVKAGLQKSKGEARRLLQNGGVYVNNTRVEDVSQRLEEDELLGGRLVLVAAGKKNKAIVRAK